MKMEHTKLLTKLNHLPIEMQSEVNDFIDFLISRKKKRFPKRNQPLDLQRVKSPFLPTLMNRLKTLQNICKWNYYLTLTH